MSDTNAVRLGSHIRTLREATGMTQADFSGKWGFNPNVLSRIERGTQNIKVETLFKIAGALNVPASQLLEGL